MIGGAITILAALVPFVIQMIAKAQARKASYESYEDQVEKDVANGNVDDINVLVHDQLRRLRQDGDVDGR